MKLKILLLLFIISTFFLKSQNHKNWPFVRSQDSFSAKNVLKLTKGDRLEQVFVGHDLIVHYRTLGVRGQDSLRYRVRGAYADIVNDSLMISAGDFKIHDRYKWNIDSSYRYLKNTRDGFARAPITDVTGIYYERSEWKKVNTAITVLSFVTAFAIAPLLALDKKGVLDLEKFRTVAYPALGLMAVSISVGIIFSQRKFNIKTPKHKVKGWMIQPNNN